MQSKEFLSLYTDSKTSEGLRCGSNITVVEMAPKMGKDLKSTRWITMNELERYHVRLLTGAKVDKILENRVVVNKENDLIDIRADYVVLAAGYRSEGKELIQWLEENRREYKVAGDAKKVGTIRSALSDAYSLNKKGEGQ